MGTVWPGFVLLALVSLVMWRVNARVFIPRQNALDLTLPAHLTRIADQVRAAAWATLFTLLLVAAIVVGSRNLENFDPALVIYTFAIIFATWGVVYHYNVWLDKPPTRMYWRRGWELFWQPGNSPDESHVGRADRAEYRCANVHRQTLATSLVDAPMPVLGLHPGRGDYLSTGVRLDRVSSRCRTISRPT